MSSQRRWNENASKGVFYLSVVPASLGKFTPPFLEVGVCEMYMERGQVRGSFEEGFSLQDGEVVIGSWDNDTLATGYSPPMFQLLNSQSKSRSRALKKRDVLVGALGALDSLRSSTRPSSSLTGR